MTTIAYHPSEIPNYPIDPTASIATTIVTNSTGDLIFAGFDGLASSSIPPLIRAYT